MILAHKLVKIGLHRYAWIIIFIYLIYLIAAPASALENEKFIEINEVGVYKIQRGYVYHVKIPAGKYIFSSIYNSSYYLSLGYKKNETIIWRNITSFLSMNFDIDIPKEGIFIKGFGICAIADYEEPFAFEDQMKFYETMDKGRHLIITYISLLQNTKINLVIYSDKKILKKLTIYYVFYKIKYTSIKPENEIKKETYLLNNTDYWETSKIIGNGKEIRQDIMIRYIEIELSDNGRLFFLYNTERLNKNTFDLDKILSIIFLIIIILLIYGGLKKR